MAHNPAQLQLGFELPKQLITAHLTLQGLTVNVVAESSDLKTNKPSDVNVLDLYLQSVGIDTSLILDEDKSAIGICFPVYFLPVIHQLPKTVTLTFDNEILPLLQVSKAQEGKVPTLQLKDEGFVLISSDSNNHPVTQIITQGQATALLHSRMLFTSSDDVVNKIRSLSVTTPVVTARARMTADNQIQITTSLPDTLERSPIRALQKAATGRYFVPGSLVDDVLAAPNISWEGRPAPILHRAHLNPNQVQLSPHHVADLGMFVGALTTYGPQALIWSSGLGRRVMALAALDSLEAFPAVIICHPSQVWAWGRHVSLFHKTSSLRHDREDVRIITWRDLPRLATSIASPAAVIADSFTTAAAITDASLEAISKLTSGVDCIRIGLASSMPEKIEDSIRAMSALRPKEFKHEQISVTYPHPSADRATQHINAYLWKRTTTPPLKITAAHFPRTNVIPVELSSEQINQINSAAYEPRLTPAARLDEINEIISSGTVSSISQKLAYAAALTFQQASSGRKVVCIVRTEHTRQLLQILLKNQKTVVVDARAQEEGLQNSDVSVKLQQALIESTGGAAAVILLLDQVIPDLSNFDVVILLHLPWNVTGLNASLAPVNGAHSQLVTLLHAPGSIDDRWAMLAIASAETGNINLEPTLIDVQTILTPRGISE